MKVEAVHARTVKFLLKAGEADHFFWALLGAAFLAAVARARGMIIEVLFLVINLENRPPFKWFALRNYNN